jgi:SAM-dependent methyltransferase
MNRIIAVKSYGFEWYLSFGLTETQAAAAMVRHGIDWAAVQNLRDPLPSTAVQQIMPPPPYDDRRFRDALHDRGIRTFEATAVFFRPDAFHEHPDMRPVDATGARMETFAWYVGLCPSSPAYLAERAAVIEEVAATLQPNGIFLSFIRFPGFWELWMPDTTRSDIPEYCFCERCLARFQTDTGIDLPDGSIPERAGILRHELRDAWTRWKCDLIASVVGTLKAAAQRGKPDVEVLVNGVAMGHDDYGNAVAEVLGQGLEALSGPADHMELMFYHQILRREPAAWISSLTREARSRTERTLLACLQTKADYLEPIYAAGRRRSEITSDEFRTALRSVADSPADGVMVYHWRDFLEDEIAGGRMTSALRMFRDGSL